MSEHLKTLEQAGLVRGRKQGRHVYYGLTSSDVAALIERAGLLAVDRPPRTLAESLLQQRERKGRLCYNHLAGELGVKLRDALIDRHILDVRGDDCVVTAEGAELLTLWCERNVNAGEVLTGCLDGTERRFHLSGALARIMAETFLRKSWLKRGPGRSVYVTDLGKTNGSPLRDES